MIVDRWTEDCYFLKIEGPYQFIYDIGMIPIDWQLKVRADGTNNTFYQYKFPLRGSRPKSRTKDNSHHIN